MIELKEYLKNNPSEENIIAGIFYDTNSYNYVVTTTDIDYNTDKRKYIHKLNIKFKEFFLIKKEDSYLIFSYCENDYKNQSWVYDKTLKNIENLEKIILVESIYSFTRNIGLASENIKKLIDIANKRKTKIIIDTFTPELVHLSNKFNLNLLRKESLSVLQ